MALAASIVENGTLSIDKSVFAVTGDKVFIRGRFYSDKPPIMSFLAAIIYYPLYKLGFTMTFQDNPAYYLITFLLQGVGLLLCVFCFYLLLREYPMRESYQVLMASALAFASLLLPWSVVLSNNSFAACCLFIGYFFMNKAMSAKPKKMLMTLAGFCQGIAVSADHTTGILVSACIAILIITKEIRGYFLFFFLPVLLLGSATLVYYQALSGSIIPFETHKELWAYAGSSWDAHALSGLHVNSPFVILKTVVKYSIGPNGFLIYNPFLIIGLYYAFILIKEKKTGWKNSFILLSGTALTVIYYCLFAEGAGGCSYSIRWFLPFLPIIYCHMWPFFGGLNKVKKAAFVMLFCFSVVMALGGVVNPWICYPKNGSAFIENMKPALEQLYKK